jgi:nitric oxide reductase subunit B
MWQTFSKWPVYYWMWGTGIVLMIFHFTEAHLWILPYFRENYIQNLTMQWKAGGAYVGAWNMLVYGLSMFVMERSSGKNRALTKLMEFQKVWLNLYRLVSKKWASKPTSFLM